MQKRQPCTEEKKRKISEAMKTALSAKRGDRPKVDRAAYMRQYRAKNGQRQYSKPKQCRQTVRAIEHAALAELETVDQFLARGGAIKQISIGATGVKL